MPPIAAPAEASSFPTSRFRVHVEERPRQRSREFISTPSNMPKRNTDKFARAKARPDPAQWGEDEVMTLVEAAAVFFPQGPLTLSSLRRAATAGTLEIAKVV